MPQHVEELLAPLPNMLSQIQQDGDAFTPTAVRRRMEQSAFLNQFDTSGFKLSGRYSQVHPSKGVSQFKAPLRLQSGVQPNQQREQGQRDSILGSLPPKVSQFKAPFRLPSGAQPNQQREQGRPASAFGVPPFNGASPLFGSTQPLPSVHVPPSIEARATYFADAPITPHNGIVTMYPPSLPITPESGLPALLSPLGGQRPSSQFFRKRDLSRRLAHSWLEAQVKPQPLQRTQTRITMKIILFGGVVLFVGGIASFLLLRFPTYLVVTWVVLIIVFSNLVSRELRSFYRLTLTTLRLAAGRPSSHDGHLGRNPLLKDIGDTTGYLKALCLVFKNDRPAQTIPPERQYKG